MGKRFDKDPSAVEQNNYETPIVNAYIIYEVDTLPKNSLNNFTLKNCLFGTTNIVKSSDIKWVYRSYEIAIDGAGSWNIGNNVAKNVAVSSEDTSSLSHADNSKNILVLGEGPTYGIQGFPQKFWEDHVFKKLGKM